MDGGHGQRPPTTASAGQEEKVEGGEQRGPRSGRGKCRGRKRKPWLAASGLGTCGRDVEWACSVLRTEWRSFKLGSEDDGVSRQWALTLAHAGTCAQKPAWEPQPPATPELRLATHKSVPTKLASFTPLSDIHSSHYEGCSSRYLIISFDMNTLHAGSAHLLPGTVLDDVAMLGIEPRAPGMLGKHSTAELAPRPCPVPAVCPQAPVYM